jgi:hypothetical protein
MLTVTQNSEMSEELKVEVVVEETATYRERWNG